MPCLRSACWHRCPGASSNANMTDVLKMTDKLEAEMPTMLSEHKEIAAALKNLKDARNG